MSHIAHAQLPWLPGIARGITDENEGAKLHVAVPLAAAMAICALHLELRYKEKSDGLVTRKDSEVPGSIVIKPEKKLDHAWMVYAPSRREPNEPDAAQMCEALIAVLLHHPRWRADDAPVTPKSQDGAPDEATSATMHDPNDFLTTDAARSFLADTEDEVCASRLEQTQCRDFDGLTAGTGQVAQDGTLSRGGRSRVCNCSDKYLTWLCWTPLLVLGKEKWAMLGCCPTRVRRGTPSPLLIALMPTTRWWVTPLQQLKVNRITKNSLATKCTVPTQFCVLSTVSLFKI